MFLKKKKDIHAFKITKFDTGTLKEVLGMWRVIEDIEGTDKISSVSFVNYFDDNDTLIDSFDGVYFFRALLQKKVIDHRKIQKEARKQVISSWEEQGEEIDEKDELFQVDLELAFEDLMRQAIICAKVKKNYYDIAISPDDKLIILEARTPGIIINCLVRESQLIIENEIVFPVYEELEIDTKKSQQKYLNWLFERCHRSEDHILGEHIKTSDHKKTVKTKGSVPYEWHKNRDVKEIDIKLFDSTFVTLKSGSQSLYSLSQKDGGSHSKHYLSLMKSFKEMRLSVSHLKRSIQIFYDSTNPEDLL